MLEIIREFLAGIIPGFVPFVVGGFLSLDRSPARRVRPGVGVALSQLRRTSTDPLCVVQ